MTAAIVPGYHGLEEIGRGGMATVYRGFDDSTGGAVALKVLPPYFGHDTELLNMFRREAATLAALDHPGVVEFLGSGFSDDCCYIALEYVHGSTLATEIESQRAGFRDVLAIARQLAGALAYVHGQGLVHRDVKPSNIMISDSGEITLVDFGISCTVGATCEESMGTAEYMSPEQCKGGAAHFPADMYSLGCVLYELLAGQPPFKAESPLAVMELQSAAAVPALDGDGAALNSIISCLMSKCPGSRLTAEELGRALDHVQLAGQK